MMPATMARATKSVLLPARDFLIIRSTWCPIVAALRCSRDAI
jgi:hypothetical protein